MTKEKKINGNTKHGDWNKRIRRIWMNMMARCHNQNLLDPNYLKYGAAGIKVCQEWHDYFVFKKWAYENGYTDQLTLDRYPNTRGNYDPMNCRWATYKEQARNKKNSKILECDGNALTVAEWADLYSINQDRINRRLKLGWSVNDAIKTPIDTNKISKKYRKCQSKKLES